MVVSWTVSSLHSLSVRVLGVAVLSRWPVPTPPSPGPWGVALSHRISERLLRSQLVAAPVEDGVASLAGRQLLERALRGAAGRLPSRLLLGGGGTPEQTV